MGINKLGIYALIEKTGKTDRYITYMLSELRKVTSKLIVAVYEEISDDEIEILKVYADEVLKIHPSKKVFDIYYEVLMKASGGNLGTLESAVFCSSDLYGPFYDMEAIFKNMEKRYADVYGINKKISIGNFEKKNVANLHSAFFVLNNKVLSDSSVMEAWGKTSKESSSKWHDFTECLLRSGYEYMPVVRNDKEEPYVGDSLGISAKEGFPFISGEYIIRDYTFVMNESRGNMISEIFRYLKNNTHYDTDMIIEHLLKTKNISDIYNAFHINYILPSNTSGDIKDVLGSKKAVVVVHIFYMDLIGYFYKYITSIPSPIDVIITTTDFEKGEKLKNVFEPVLKSRLRVIVSIGNGRELAALLVETREIIREYDYICFTHDKKSPHNRNINVSKGFQELIVENVINSPEYITNVIDVMEKDKRIGLLVPPPPMHGNYFASLGRRWTVCFEAVKSLILELGVCVDMDESKPPLATGSSFWCKKEALEPLFEKKWTHEDFPPEPMASDGTISHAIERSFPFIAQSKGFYCGILMTLENASLEFTNREYYLEKLHFSLHKMIPTYGQNFGSYQKKIENYDAVKEVNIGLKRALKAYILKLKNRSFGKLKQHMEEKVRVDMIKKSKLFDSEWYLNTYPDVAASGADPAKHYFLYGWKEGRNPSAVFSTSEYFDLNQDVKSSRICPLYHFESAGKFEGRSFSKNKDIGINTEPTASEYAKYNKRIKDIIKREKKRAANENVKQNKIVFRTFQQDYTCNPKYICEELLRRKLPYDIVWLCKDDPEVIKNFPVGVRVVREGSADAKKEIFSAKILIDNGVHYYNFKGIKKPEQVSICTWHGSMGFKKLAGNKIASKRMKRSAELYDANNDYVISNSTFEDEVFRESYWPTTEFIKCGHPRNDILINVGSDKEKASSIKNKVCRKLGIDPNSKIALYAPTFREKLVEENANEHNPVEELDYNVLKDALCDRFGGNWCIITRVHFVNASDVEYAENLPEFCYNGTNYPDIQELMIASDAAFTDYSSWILDFMFTRKPAFLFTPDYSEYEYQRGFCYPLNEAPFSIAENNSELAKNISDFNSQKYNERVEEFLVGKGSREDGKACKVIVDKINSITGIGI